MICNKDCFACPYPDCINDEMDAADRRESRERDKLLGVPRREKCSESAAAEEHRRRALAYYRAHAAEINAKRRGNPRIKEQHRAYYLRHREEILARQKEYNRRRAAEKRAAMEALRDKLFEDMPEEERIAEFVKAHKWGKQYPSADYYDWHNRLTGSCEMGRSEFAAAHGYKLTADELLTVEEFIDLTEGSYGGDIIRRLREAYNKEET